MRKTSNFATVANASPILLKEASELKDEEEETENIQQKWKKNLVTKKIRKTKIKYDDDQKQAQMSQKSIGQRF